MSKAELEKELKSVKVPKLKVNMLVQSRDEDGERWLLVTDFTESDRSPIGYRVSLEERDGTNLIVVQDYGCTALFTIRAIYGHKYPCSETEEYCPLRHAELENILSGKDRKTHLIWQRPAKKLTHYELETILGAAVEVVD